MSSSVKYVNEGNLDMQVTLVAPAFIVRENRFVFNIFYNDEEYNLKNYYVEVYVNGELHDTTQEESIDLIIFRSLITLDNLFITVVLKTKRIINGYHHYSDIETTFNIYDFLVSNDTFCSDDNPVRA